MKTMVSIRTVHTSADLHAVKCLFLEYGDTPGVGVCVVGFAGEIAALPAGYDLILLAEIDGVPIGCAALRQLGGEAELKRLYVNPSARGSGAGRLLAESIIEAARSRGYRLLRLDTLPSMVAAIRLYESLGFKPAEAYYAGAPSDSRFYELSLV
ncbi:MAG TPA: GNAT family N-acetyltransferase [Bryobacteraceae bacterium]|nr:GNAT family N-acetyltransferase [Bryobacteraceae bacterium]HPT24829.1 GNAT family N-acetyltransferase [Bryobacteraceae bacterium]